MNDNGISYEGLEEFELNDDEISYEGLEEFELEGLDNDFDQSPWGPVTKKEDDSWQITKGFKAGIDQTQAMGGGLVAALGDAFDNDDLKEWGVEVYEQNMEEALENAGDVAGFTEIGKDENYVSDFADWAFYTAGNMAPMLATSLIGGGLGGAVAHNLAGAIAKKAATKLIARKVGQAAGAFAASAGMQTGSIYGEIKDIDAPNKASTAFAHGAVAGALDALPVKRILDRAGIGDVAGDAIKDSVMKFAGKQLVSEGVTEGLQSIVEQHAKYWVDENQKNFDIDWAHVINSAAAGALMGGVSGAGVSAISKPDLSKQVTDAREEAKESGGDALDQTIAGHEALSEQANQLEGFGSTAERQAEIDAARQARMDQILNKRGQLDPEYFNRSNIVDPSQPVDFVAPEITESESQPIFQENGSEIEFEARPAAELGDNLTLKAQSDTQSQPLYGNEIEFDTGKPSTADELASNVEREIAVNDYKDKAIPKRGLLPRPESMQMPGPVAGNANTGMEHETFLAGRMDSDPIQNKEDSLAAVARVQGGERYLNEKISDAKKEQVKKQRQSRLPEGLTDERFLKVKYQPNLIDAAKKFEAAGRQAGQDKVLPQRDDLFAAIAKNGGINKPELARDGFDPDDMTAREGIRPVFSRKGRSVDDMAEALIQDGYLSERNVEELKNRIRLQISGDPQYSLLYEQDGFEGMIAAARQVGASPTQSSIALNKALGNKKLTEKQSRIVSRILDEIQGEYEDDINIAYVQQQRAEKNALRKAIRDNRDIEQHFNETNSQLPDNDYLEIDASEFDQTQNLGQDEQIAVEALIDAIEAGIPESVTDELALRYDEPEAFASQVHKLIRESATHDRQGNLNGNSETTTANESNQSRSETPAPEETGRDTEVQPQEMERSGPADRGRQADGQLEDNEPLLSSYTEQDIQQREAERKAAEQTEAEQEAKAEADSQVDDFQLTGSDRQADADPNQGDIFDSATNQSIKPTGNRRGNTETYEFPDGSIQSRADDEVKPLDKRPPSVQRKYQDDEGALDIERYEAEEAKRTKRHDELKRIIENDSDGAIFRNKASTLFYTVTPAANGSKKYQVTVWDKKGPLSDSKHDTAESIIRNYGYGTEFAVNATEDEFNQLLSSQSSGRKVTNDTPINFSAIVRDKNDSPFHVNSKRAGKMNIAPFENGKPQIHSDNPTVTDLENYTFNDEWWENDQIIKRKGQVEDKAESKEKFEDFGNELGGARKDMGITRKKGEQRVSDNAKQDNDPSYFKKYEINEIVAIGGWLNQEDVGKFQLTRKPKGKRSHYNQGKRIGVFDTPEEARLAIPVAEVSQKHKVRKAGEDNYEIFRDVARGKYPIIKGGFKSREEAMTYMALNPQEIMDINKNFTEADLRANLKSITRTGKEHRKGNVKPQDFQDTFGFYAGQFGNWNNSTDRQDDLNYAYDALMDLADTLSLPPKAISLNGELSLAFGARGHGLSSASAHYERDYGVINLTKEKGAGALAHEWLHAMDHYFGRQDGKAGGREGEGKNAKFSTSRKGAEGEYISHGFSYGSKVRQEVRDAFHHLVKTTFYATEEYIEDTTAATKIIDDQKKTVTYELKRVRDMLLQDYTDNEYHKRHKKPASKEQLAEFDKLASRITSYATANQKVPMEEKYVESKSRYAMGKYRSTNDDLEAISAILKKVRGRTGWADKQVMNHVSMAINRYNSASEKLSESVDQVTKKRRVPTNFRAEAKKIDLYRVSDYWSTEHEMMARAFEGYIQDKIKEEGNRSDYLSFGADNARYVFEDVKPYPEGEERARINKAFDQFFDTLQTKETDQGTALFSRSQAPVKQSTGSPELRSVVEDFMSYYNGNIPIEPLIVDKQEDAYGPEGTAEKIGAIEGAYHAASRKVVLVSSAIRDASAGQRVLRHELLGHYGLNTFNPEDKRALLEKILASKNSRNLSDTWKKVDTLYKDKTDLERAEEVFAFVAEGKDSTVKKLVDLIAAPLSKLLRKAGLAKSAISRSELRQIVRRIGKGIRNGTTVQQTFPKSDGAQFSRIDVAGEQEAEALEKLGLSPKESKTITAKINEVVNRNWKAAWTAFKARSYEGLFDGLSGLKEAEKRAGVSDSSQSGYVGARLATGVADTMTAILNYGAPEWRDGVLQYKEGTRGLLEILGDLDESLTDWLAWMGGNRAQELLDQGRENNLTQADINALKARAEGKEALFEQVRQDYMTLNKAMLDMAEEAGLIKAGARSQWESDYYVPFYRQSDADGNADSVLLGPRTSRGLSHQSAGIKALKGGETATNDLLENILTNWVKLTDSAMKNSALLKTVNNLEGTEYLTNESMRYEKQAIPKSELNKRIKSDRKYREMVADFLGEGRGTEVNKLIDQVAKLDSEGYELMWAVTAPTDPDVIRVTRNGKNEYYRVNDAALLRSVTHLNAKGSQDPITKTGRYFKRLLTTGITASPDFIFRNFIRDAAHAWAINPDGFTFGKDSFKGLKLAIEEDADYRALMFSGASFQGGYVHGTDPEASAHLVRRALEKKGLNTMEADVYQSTLLNTPHKLKNAVERSWQTYRNLGDKVENANRLGTFKAALESGKPMAQAVFESKDLMDYSMRGNFAALQWFTDVIPFLNARMQGLSKLGRAAKENPRRVLLQAGMKIATFSVALAYLNDDDERYQQLPDWDKDANWHFFVGDDHYRIPKPFEIGIVFGTMPERMYHTLAGNQDNEKLLWSLQHNLLHTLNINPTPQFVMPIAEVVANKSFFFETPIEGMADEGKLTEARYNERTSSTMVELGALSKWIGVSPKELEHLWNGYLGTLGMYALGATDILTNHLTDRSVRPETRIEDMPVFKSFYKGSGPAKSTQYMTDVYDRMKEVDEIARTIKAYRMEGKGREASELQNSERDKLRYRRALGRARKQLGNINKQMERISRSNALSAATKRKRMDILRQRKNDIARKYAEITERAF